MLGQLTRKPRKPLVFEAFSYILLVLFVRTNDFFEVKICDFFTSTKKLSKPYMKKGHTHNTTKLHPLFFIDDRKGTA